ncbi:hypothetical protein BC629DRAFT_1286996 [Irpex lacteus]|nr:hypothetical protein BC629DRAFT_1286996 [Irpex lacteus]
MTRRQWATAEQLAWLRARAPAYLEARQKGELSTWWPQTYQAWFDTWPLEEPSADNVAEANGSREAAEKQLKDAKEDQVYWWYVNNHRGNGNGSNTRKVLPLGQKKRKPHMHQVYLKLYKAKLMPEINKRWEERDGDKTDGKQKLAFIGKCAKEMFQAESAEVKEEVARFRDGEELPGDAEETKEVKALRTKQQ